jgi:hypothetical protein
MTHLAAPPSPPYPPHPPYQPDPPYQPYPPDPPGYWGHCAKYQFNSG